MCRLVRNAAVQVKLLKRSVREMCRSGLQEDPQALKDLIPAVVDNGISVRVVVVLVELGKNGGPRGDLLVGLWVDSHPIFSVRL